MKNFLVSALFGVTSLFLVNFTAAFTGLELAVSKLSLLVSSILGIPGVITMLILNFIL